jgi:N-acetylmuramoyl-L-alanine amidase
MSNEHDRRSSQRQVITVASIVTAVALVVGIFAVLVGTLLSPRVATSSGTLLPATQSSASTTTAPSIAPPATTVASSAPEGASAPTDAAVRGVVVIDPGHQGHEDARKEPIGPGSSQTKPRVASGAEGVVTRAPESRVNLEIALRLQRVLEARGVKVVMVRTSQNVDIPNSQRAKLANDNHAALFIRLHCDGVDNQSVHGFLVLRPGSNKWTRPIVAQSKTAASCVSRATLAATGARDRGIIPRDDQTGFNWSQVPTIVAEMGVMSNPAEDRKLSTSSYQQELASGMADGIVEYLKSK